MQILDRQAFFYLNVLHPTPSAEHRHIHFPYEQYAFCQGALSAVGTVICDLLALDGVLWIVRKGK